MREDDRITIAADSDERADKLLDQVKRELEEEGHRVDGMTRERRSEHRPMVTKTLKISMPNGVRMGAKLGLAFGAEVFDESWRLSDHAKQLREWLWDPVPKGKDGEVLAWNPGSPDDHPLADPPNHVASFMSLSSGCMLFVLVLGKLGFTVPVGPPDQPPPGVAWRMKPGALPEVTTFDELILEATKKMIDAHGD